MPYPEEFPHVVLNIGRCFTLKELKTAFGLANMGNKRSEKNTIAFRALSNIKTRLEYEILLPTENSDMEAELAQLLGGMEKTEYISRTCPPLPLPHPLSDMTEADIESDFHDLQKESLDISLSDSYDNIKQVKSPVIFDT